MKPGVWIVIAVVLFACGKNQPAVAVAAAAPPPPPPPSIDACTLMSRAEVETIFGELKVDPKSATGLSNERECRYQRLDGHWLKTSLYGAERWGLEKGIVSEMHPAPLPNLGDEAFSVKQGTDSVIYIRKGGGILEVSCSCGMETTKAIAAKAITKI